MFIPRAVSSTARLPQTYFRSQVGRRPASLMEWKTGRAPVDRQMEQRTPGASLLPRALTPGLAWPGLSLSSPLPRLLLLLPEAGCLPPSFCPRYCPSSPLLTPDHLGLFFCLASLWFVLPPFLIPGLSPSSLVPLVASPHPPLSLTSSPPPLCLSGCVSLTL